jgi:lipoprotein-anchoring transpeptidase ErfK/SrfK
LARPLVRAALAVIALVVLAVIALVVLVGLGACDSRSSGGGTAQPAVSPSPDATAVVRPRQTAAPVPHWQIAKAVGSVVSYAAPSTSAPIRARFNRLNVNDRPTVFLVRSVRKAGGATWYDVWLPIRPNESRGWVRQGSVAIHTTTARIVVNLARHRLYVYKRGLLVGKFRVAVGMPGLSTPTGTYYVNQKLRPAAPGGPYGVLALGLSAFQPKLPNWPQGGQVAIHGTNQDYLIGRAVSHGCVRMRNADVLKVSAWVPIGSPVVIVK